MMVTNFRSLPVHATLSDAVDLLLSGEQREFPVVDNLGRTEGILTRDNLIRGLSQRGPGSTVAQAMTSGAPTVAPALSFQEALERLRASGLPALPVVDPTGALVGLLTSAAATPSASARCSCGRCPGVRGGDRSQRAGPTFPSAPGAQTGIPGSHLDRQPPMGGVVFLDKGARGSFDVELTAGDYGFICFVPDTKDGKPHLAHGMMKTIEVG
jgi:hypothetical protein